MQKSVNFLELIGGGKIPEVLVGTWIVMGILIVFGFIARASIAGAADPVIPDDYSSAVEKTLAPIEVRPRRRQ